MNFQRDVLCKGEEKEGERENKKRRVVRLNFDAEVQEEAHNFHTGIHEG